MNVKREQYLEKLRQLRDKKIIKVITGIRRSGKSTLLKQFKEELIASGVSEVRVQQYNYEDLEVERGYKEIYEEIKNKLSSKGMNYIFLDEIQNIDNFERIVDSLFVQDNVDLYITGSNAFLLSSELATYLSGRYMEINILPFSFREYLECFDNNASKQELFSQYIVNGGMPQSVEMFDTDYALGLDYLRGVYSTVVLKDIMTRNDTDDANAFSNILKFLFDNVGNLVSPNKIANYLKANHKSIDPRKVERLIDATCKSYILYPANRFSIKGKELLRTQQKYYMVDTGFRRMLLGIGDERDYGHLLENVVFLELKRRGYEIFVGQTKNGKEVDFVAKNRRGEVEYYQVSDTIKNDDTRERELGALISIDDNRPKYILSNDLNELDFEGVKHFNVIEWLLGDKR
jgi:predicted AAA+ superfamily ATPase